MFNNKTYLFESRCLGLVQCVSWFWVVFFFILGFSYWCCGVFVAKWEEALSSHQSKISLFFNVEVLKVLIQPNFTFQWLCGVTCRSCL